jgi:hypothetical protein
MVRFVVLTAVALFAAAPPIAFAMETERLASASGKPRRLPLSATRTSESRKPVLGPTTLVAETESGFAFAARVDTGAKSCSIHAEDIDVVDGSPRMEENVGKLVRFRINNPDGKPAWLERSIAEVAFVKNSDCSEWRYKVPLTLRCEGKEREVLVSLNDRSEMRYSALIGRNFLAGTFLVEVGAGE